MYSKTYQQSLEDLLFFLEDSGESHWSSHLKALKNVQNFQDDQWVIATKLVKEFIKEPLEKMNFLNLIPAHLHWNNYAYEMIVEDFIKNYIELSEKRASQLRNDFLPQLKQIYFTRF